MSSTPIFCPPPSNQAAVRYEIFDSIEAPSQGLLFSTPSTPRQRKRPLKQGQQARVKCDNCRADHLRVSGSLASS